MIDPSSLVGEVLDRRYRLARFLGEGAFGWVYAAEELVGGESVGLCALKLLRPRNDQERASVLGEIRAMAALSRNHLGLVGYGSAGSLEEGFLRGSLYLTMELAEHSLEHRLERPARMTAQEVRKMCGDLADALAYLHSRGAVHRDVKPANLFFASGRWKLGDLGLARPVESSQVTASGMKGTPLYMAPEAFAGRLGPSVDVWSMGVMVQQALTGVLAYQASSVGELAAAVLSREPHLAPNLPAPLDAIVRGCLVKDPRARWTAAQVLEALSRSAQPSAAPPVSVSTSAPVQAPPPARPAAAPAPSPAPRPVAPPAQAASPRPSSAGTGGGWKVPVVVLLMVVGFAVAFFRPGIEGTSAIPSGMIPLGRNAQGRERFQVEGGGPVLVSLPAGRFVMGSPAGEEGRDGDETQHEVVLSRDFLLGEAELTQAEYAAVVGTNPSRFKGQDRPVDNVSWFDAVSFCNALSRRVGLEAAYVVDGESVTWRGPSCPGFRLPTEAEWEYACRAGTTGARHGNLDAVAWYDGNSGGSTHPVGQKQPNPWGLHDTLGNVWEWCWDWYGIYPPGVVTDPQGPGSGSYRVDRGGSWGNGAQNARAADRRSFGPDDRLGNLGFRLARSLP